MTLAVSSPGHTCGLVLIIAVLLQSVCVAITFLYFTNELKQSHLKKTVNCRMKGMIPKARKRTGRCLYSLVQKRECRLNKKWTGICTPKMREAYSKSAIGCFLGEDLGAFHRTLESRDIKDRDEEHDPCWQVKRQLPLLIKKILLKNYQADISSAVKGEISRLLPRVVDEKYGSKFPMPRIAAHVTGNSLKASSAEEKDPLSGKISGKKLKTWDTERGLSLLNNVDFSNGELLIKKTGYYYIYAQTYFRYHEPERAGDTDEAKRVKQMVQYIYKTTTSYPDPILLMKSAKTTCWAKKAEYGLFSVYQGGVFELKYNNSVFISVSDKNLIDMDKEASFFGAFLIG